VIENARREPFSSGVVSVGKIIQTYCPGSNENSPSARANTYSYVSTATHFFSESVAVQKDIRSNCIQIRDEATDNLVTHLFSRERACVARTCSYFYRDRVSYAQCKSAWRCLGRQEKSPRLQFFSSCERWRRMARQRVIWRRSSSAMRRPR
jgi:hypothetical protein